MDHSIFDAEGWLACHVTVEVPGFSGFFPCTVWRPDLELFDQELTQMYAHVGLPFKAEFTTTEPGIKLDLSMNEAGQIDGRFVFQFGASPGGTTLSGSFAMDQTFLPDLSRQIATILRDEA